MARVPAWRLRWAQCEGAMRRGHVCLPGEEMPGSASSIRLSISITCDPTSGDHLNLVHLKKLHGQLKSCATPRAAERMRTVPCLG